MSNRKGSAISNRRVGDVLEDLVALLHESPGIDVQKRVCLPVQHQSGRKREIDILISGHLSGYPISVAIECKNYRKPIGVSLIDEFKGKLEDVGIPVQQGIFVTSGRFTAGALDRAKTIGMKTLQLSGLTSDRLAQEVYDAFQSVVFLLADITKISVLAKSSSELELFLIDSGGNPTGYLMDLVWLKWRDGDIPREIGEHSVELDLPQNWSLSTSDKPAGTPSASVYVSGLVVTVPGTASNVALEDQPSGLIERFRIKATFDTSQQSYPVTVARTEQQLQEVIDAPARAHVVVRIPLPRIRINGLNWPPSDRTLAEIAYLSHRAFRAGYGFRDLSNILDLGRIEGQDLRTMWEPIASSHPAANNFKWPFRS